jgi:hypothetical protein
VRWDLDWLRFSWLRVLNAAKVEELVILLLVEALSKLINTSDSELSAESFNNAFGFNLITSQVVISDEVLTWLLDCE